MVKYIALEDIDGYKKGQEVPEEKGKVWAQMYKKSPVEIVGESAPSKKGEKSEKTEQPAKVEEKKSSKK